MSHYIFKRLLLMIPTGIGVITVFFFISEFVPGGPLDQVETMIINQANQADPSSMATMSSNGGSSAIAIDPRTRMQIKRELGLNHDRFERYMRTLLWVGADSLISSVEIEPNSTERVEFQGNTYLAYRNNNDEYFLYNNSLTINGVNSTLSYDREDNVLRATVDQSIKYNPASGEQINGPLEIEPIPITVKTESFQEQRFLANGETVNINEIRDEVYISQSFTEWLTDWDNWHGLFLLKFPPSISKNRDSLMLIVDRLPVSMRLGISSFFLTYITCVTLGLVKAVGNGSRFDSISSAVILVCYGIPGFVLAVFLLKGFGPSSDSFIPLIPLKGLHSPEYIYQELSFLGKIWDNMHHLIAPVVCMSIGSFATLTLLTKNSVLEQRHQLYAVAARARGLSKRRVLVTHIFRNSMIPLVTGFPGAFVFMFFTGSVLIEKIFSIDGLGLLSYTALVERDYPLILSSMFVFTYIGLLCQLLADLTYVIVDPRISFEGNRS